MVELDSSTIEAARKIDEEYNYFHCCKRRFSRSRVIFAINIIIALVMSSLVPIGFWKHQQLKIKKPQLYDSEDERKKQCEQCIKSKAN